MVETVSPSNGSSAAMPGGGVAGLARAVLYLCLAAGLVTLAYAQYQTMQAKASLQKSEESLVSQFGVGHPARKQLASKYSDKQGRLLADPPTDPAELLNPETIVVAYGEDSDLDVQPIEWREFEAHLETTTGKPVEMQLYNHTGDDVAAIRDGKVHVIALHAADAPYVVNTAGLIPVAVVGSEAGAEGNHFDLVVSKNSKVRNLSDLKGRTLTCSMPTSIVGHRAAVAVLLQEAGLRPSIDYLISFSGGQRRSVEGIAAAEFEIAALSNDKIEAMVADGDVQMADLNIVYQSEVIPRFTIGHVYNLEPQLAAKIRDAILSFENSGGPVDEDGQPMRFVATDYKKDFAFMRMIDDWFDPRLKPNMPKSEADGEPDAGAPQT